MLPLILGFESQVTGTTTLRAAVRKNLYQSTTIRSTTETWEAPISATSANATTKINTVTKKDKTTSVWDTDTTLTLGAGYKVDSFVVDAVLQKEFVTAGTDNGLVSRVNVTYLLP
jgi:tRNA A37 threonylcarbamoyladenosine synthetase subunit TsaC/SUA5/YrdC